MMRMKHIIAVVWVLCSLLTAQAGMPFHVVLLGDSNTFIGGDDCDKPRGWNYWFCQQLKPCTCRSYARSGATWTHTAATVYDIVENTEVLSDNNVIFNQVNRLKQAYADQEQPEPDLILIMAGTNDAWFRWANIQTLADYVRSDCELLTECFPQAQIVLITPMQNTKTSVEQIEQTGDVIEQCGHSMGLNVIRLDQGCGITRNQEMKKKTFTTDGVHTNEAGAKRVGTYIAHRLQAILHK